jgi:EAL domain-containing protein (putative c-di-GMP-specific phosphodiesterase class I)
VIGLKLKNNATVGGLRALEQYFRPIGNVLSGETIALQTAFRMNSPSRGVIFPNEYLPVLEAYPDRAADFMPLVFYHLYDAIENFKKRDIECRFITLPMPVSFLKRADAVTGIVELAKAFHIHSDNICFELSSALYGETDDTASKAMFALQREGFTFMLNSFGGEDSPTMLLSSFPVDYVMINGLYTTEAMLGERHEGWVRSALSYITSLNCSAIATEVVNSAQGDKLSSLGCSYCVGDYTGDWVQRKYVRLRTGDEQDDNQQE